MEKDKKAFLLKEKESLNQTMKEKNELILAQNQEIQIQQEKLSELENELFLEKDDTNEILNIKVSDERLRQAYLDEAKQKIKLYNVLVRIMKDFLPELIKVAPKFIRELLDYKILHKEDLPEVDDMLKMTRKKLVQQKHPYAINNRTNGRVITTVREDGKLKQISAVTMEGKTP